MRSPSAGLGAQPRHSRLSAAHRPAAYGLGTGLPVVGFALLIALGARGVAKTFNRLTGFERVARVATGVIFLGARAYLIATHLFGLGI